MATITTYSASVWVQKARQVRQKQQINAAQRGVLVRLTGAYRTTSSDALQVIAGVLPLDLEIVRSAAEYWLRKGDLQKVQEALQHPATNKNQIRKHIHTIWQNRWNESVKGRRLYNLLPDIQERLNMRHFSPSKGLIQFLTDHGPYAQYLHKHGLAQTDLCACGEIGTPEHVCSSAAIWQIL